MLNKIKSYFKERRINSIVKSFREFNLNDKEKQEALSKLKKDVDDVYLNSKTVIPYRQLLKMRKKAHEQYDEAFSRL